MPDNKNQHFVPRCHLKPFTIDREGVAINLFNLRGDIVRPRVSVSGQCAKPYFYGDDLVIEKQLQQLEGEYASLVRRIEASADLDDADLATLRDFVFLQWCRTDAAVRRRRDAMIAMDELARRGIEHATLDPPDLSQRSLMLGSLRIWASSGEEIEDLRVLVLHNKSRVDFVTSDDPAVITNRVFLQRMRDRNFGLMNVGVMMLMPLGPRHAVVCYDHDCYSPEGRSGNTMTIGRDRDAKAFNELQYLNAFANIYFADPLDNAAAIVADYKAIAERRTESKLLTWQGISEGIQGEFECFRRLGEQEDFDPRTPRFQSFSPLYPIPAHWISNFRMRPRIQGWVRPGTAVGPVRARKARKLGGMKPVKVGIGPLPGRGGDVPERIYLRLSSEEIAKSETVNRDAAALRGIQLT